MSDYKPNENLNNTDDVEELLQLLERLKKRDEVSRYQASISQLEDLIMDEEPEPEPVQPARFQPTEQTAVDARDLLLSDMEDPLKMSEYLIDSPDSSYLIGDDEPDMLYFDEGEDLPEPPKNRRNPFKALWMGFCGNLPRKEDSVATKIRKGGFLLSLLVMLLAIIYLVVDLLVIPAQNERLKQELIALYHPEKADQVVTKQEIITHNYPQNMLAAFTDLYDRNNEVRGWIRYHAGGKEDFLKIDYPIVYRNEKDTENFYLTHDYDGDTNKNGTLYFSQHNKVNSSKEKNRALIVYGHNMASGQMFAGLNKMMGNLNNARAAATFTMSTLFRQDQYKVFAVVLIDESDRNERSYNMWRTQFAGDADFMRHIDGIQARSMFNYEEVVDVKPDDQILVLSTCTGKSSAHVKDGRLLVVARRVREGEDPNVDTSKITKKSYAPNSDDSVIMPYYWYINQNKPVHKYYTENGLTSGPVQLPTVSTQSTQKKPTTTQPGQSTTTTGSTDVNGTTSTTDPTQSAPSDSGAESSPTSQTTETTKPTETVCKHTYTDVVTTPATCTGKGVKTYTCSLCNDSYTEDIPANGHKFTGGCESKCENCEVLREHEYSYDCDKDCNNCGKLREAAEHKYGDPEIKEPTCGEDGSIQKSCTECNYTHTVEKLSATGEHIYDDDNDAECNICRYERDITPTEPTEPTEQ